MNYRKAKYAMMNLPTPPNISAWWNMGSILGLSLTLQILTGLFLAMHYSSDTATAFYSVMHIQRDVNYGWFIQSMHANGASLAFICMYLHIARSLYYGSYLYKGTWNMGVILLLLMMMTAFVGYVLPWGQMSFWGATVITNLLSAAPYIGEPLVQWLWGDFSVSSPTLNRFFVFHFLLPFIIMAMVTLHLILLHKTGSNNPLGVNSNADKISFHPYFYYKDLLGFMTFLFFLLMIVLFTPHFLEDPENFSSANPLITPPHIKPEWYFLFAYAILRSIPNKLGGVIALLASILILTTMPFIHTSKQRSLTFQPFSPIFTWLLMLTIVTLTWIGNMPVEYPFTIIGQNMSMLYFILFLILIPLSAWLENKILGALMA